MLLCFNKVFSYLENVHLLCPLFPEVIIFNFHCFLVPQSKVSHVGHQGNIKNYFIKSIRFKVYKLSLKVLSSRRGIEIFTVSTPARKIPNSSQTWKYPKYINVYAMLLKKTLLFMKWRPSHLQALAKPWYY